VTTTNGSTSTTVTKPKKPKKIKGIDVNGDGRVDELDDLNNDGVANQKDVELRQDKISMDVLQVDYDTAWQIMSSDPQLSKIFKDAIAGSWDQRTFDIALQRTDWWENQGHEFARKAWLAEKAGTKGDWEDQMNKARDTIGRQASQMGAVIPDGELDQLARRYIYQGWYDPSRAGMMVTELSSLIDGRRGNAATIAKGLRELAGNNGVTLTDQWLQEVTQSLARGESSQIDWENWVREEAAKRYPMFADRIMAGVSVRSLASPYTSRMADILELSEEAIGLDDYYVTKALGSMNEKGEMQSMSLSDFENLLRADPRWEKTKNGKNTLMDMSSSMLRSWGFVE
jgi:hypothetical protein